MSQPINITAATEADLPALCALLHELFTIEQDFAPDAQRQAAGLRMLLGCPQRCQVLVARHDSAGVVGMVSGQLVFSSAEGALSAWVEDLVVAAPFRRLGLGGRLLSRITAWARDRGATRAQLLVDDQNHSAEAFYGAGGWRRTRLRAMQLPLRPPV